MALERRCTTLAALLLAGQVLTVLLTDGASVLVAVPALAIPGLALVPWLPASLRADRQALVAAVVPIGALVLSLAVIGLGAVGMPLRPGWLLLVLGAFVAAGVAGLLRGPGRTPVPAAGDQPWWAWATLGGALLLALALMRLVNADLPTTGNDWAKYLLYADQARQQGSLLIDNPYWLLGQPFREDPGAPALYTTLLVLSGGSASELGYGIQGLLLLSVLATFATAKALFGARAAAPAVVAFVVMPSNVDMTAWHGLANMWGLVLLPLALLTAGKLLRGERDRAWIVLLAAAIVGLLCAHRLTALIAVGALGLLALGALVRAPRPTAKVLLQLAAAGLAVGLLPAFDLLDRQGDAGGLQSYTAYLGTKIAWSNVLRDLTVPVAASGVVALVALVLIKARRRDPAAWIGVALLGATLAYGYSWIVHFPGFYVRASYFLPLALALVLAAALPAARDKGRERPLLFGALAIGLLLAINPLTNARDFYRYVDDGALKGYAVLGRLKQPGDVVVADSCTSFVSTWLLETPTLAALVPYEIGPAAELPRVEEARAIFAGGAKGRETARRVNARWLLVNPSCPGRTRGAPEGAVVRYASLKLVVFELPKA